MHPRRRFSTSLLPQPTLLALACALAAGGAQAQSGTATPQQIEALVVTGQAASLRKSIARQQQADTVVSVVSADDIGALPDKNVAEAVARLPGVSVQRDQGEGRYVVVRGLGPELNAVTINGALLPSPEQSTRAVSLDVLPSGLVGSIEVHKTLTPDRDANSLGGTVEVKSLSAFDLPRGTLRLGLAVSHDENIRRDSPSGSLLWADRFLGGTLGVAIGLSAERRQFGSDNVETGGQWTSNGRLAGFELRDYQPTRERNALGLNLEYRPQADQSWYLRTLQSRFSDTELRDRLTVSNVNPATGLVEGQAATTVRAERRLRDRKYAREINAFQAGGERRWDGWKIEAAAGFSSANENTPEQLNDARFRQNNVAGVGFTNTQVPTLFGPAALTNPANYSLNAITLQQRTSRDAERHLKADLTRSFELGGNEGSLKFGFKSSRREKRNDTEQWSYNSSSATSPNYWGAGSTSMSAFVTGYDAAFPYGSIGPALSAAAVRARVAGLNRAAARSVAASLQADYRMREDTDAAYLMGTMSFGAWELLAGARHERTDFRAEGYQINGATITPVDQSSSHAKLLPSLHLRYDWDRQTTLRAALSNSLVRPDFSQLAPAVVYGSPTEVTIGNPNLKPLRSANIDFGIERALGRDGVVSAYAFSKRIRDFTYGTNLAGTGPWVGFTSAATFANGDGGHLHGIELAYNQALRGLLPAPWDRLLIGANASFTKSSVKVSRYDGAAKQMLARDIRLPGQSNTVLNLMLGYEYGPLSARLALNHKSPYLLSLGGDILNPAQDLIVDRQSQLDLSVKVQINRSLQASFEVSNLNDEKYYVYQGSKPFNAQFERYGRTVKIGLSLQL
jgi:TonB-dependent receptor